MYKAAVVLFSLLLPGLLLPGLLFSGPGMAQLPSADPAGQYRLIGRADGSDSRCIGRPESPLCAVETLLACFARRDEALCRQVWQPPRPDLPLFTSRTPPGYWWSYRVAAAESVAAGEVVIAIAGRSCGPLSLAPDCLTTPAPPTSYRVRRMGDGWQVVDWGSPPGRWPAE